MYKRGTPTFTMQFQPLAKPSVVHRPPRVRTDTLPNDLGHSITQQLLPRHVAWRRAYDARRYARHLSQTELNRRTRDLILNLLNLSDEAYIDLGALTDESTGLIEKFTHVLEEMQLRHGPYPAGFTRDVLHSEPFPDFASDLAKKAAKTLTSLGLRRGDVFLKFGKREYMQPLHESGALRIQPASYFAQQDHNGAIRDDELQFSFSGVLSRDEILKLVRDPQDIPADFPEQRADMSIKSPTDYWLYCVTSSVKPRLFVDFDADACVIIRDRARFRQMLDQATREQMAGGPIQDGPALYVDPLFPTTGAADLFLPFVKHFRYAYQDEHRFCWLPQSPTPIVTLLDVRIGSLKEFSDLVVL